MTAATRSSRPTRLSAAAWAVIAAVFAVAGVVLLAADRPRPAVAAALVVAGALALAVMDAPPRWRRRLALALYVVGRCCLHLGQAVSALALAIIAVIEARTPDVLLAVLYGVVAVVVAASWWSGLCFDLYRLRIRRRAARISCPAVRS